MLFATALVLIGLTGEHHLFASAEPWCQQARITGYVRGAGNPRTFDGTPITTNEAIAAAGWDVEIDSEVWVEGLGNFRVADRGRLGPGHIDVAVWTRAEALALTSVRRVCVYPPGSLPVPGPTLPPLIVPTFN